MNVIVDATIRTTGLILIGLAAAALLRHRPAAVRHCVLAAAIFAAAIAAPLSLIVPPWAVTPLPLLTGNPEVPKWRAKLESPPELVVAVPVSAPAAVHEDGDAPGVSGVFLATAFWAAGFVISAVLLLVQLFRLARVSARATPLDDPRWLRIVEDCSRACGIRRRIRLLQTSTPDLLATWGAIRPRVLLPAQATSWSDERIHAVVCHELAHIRRHDWLVQLIAEAVRTIHWFNPLVWAACRGLRRESEHACDDAVLSAGVPAQRYAEDLLALARTFRLERRWASAMPVAHRSFLERRIAVMLNTTTLRGAVSGRALVIVAVLFAAAAFTTAALRSAQEGPLPLKGSVYDPSGGVLPGVELTLQDAQEFKWQDTTDAEGRFDFPPVQPGKYVLEMSLPGFGKLRQDFELKGASDWDRAITMSVGQLSETVTVSATRLPAPPRPVADPAPTRVRVGGNIKAPMKIRNVNPVYPESMREAGRQGIVRLEAVIGRDGSVLAAGVLGAHVHPDFGASALDAVRQWQFSPTLLNGTPVEVVMNVTIAFRLE